MNTFLPVCKKAAVRVGQKGRSLLLLAALGLPVLVQAQTATFPRNASFTDTNTNNFTLGGSAFLTATGSSATNGVASGTPIDASGSGALRLTNAVGNQAGYAIDNTTFATPNGFSISFEFFSYGSTTSPNPADGFGIFLVDGAGTDPATQFKIGGIGGSLGYAPSNNPTNSGATNGYLGIGLDEFGNYSNPTEGRTGGPGQVANVVALRGSASNNYAYLTGTSSGTTSTLGTTLSVGGTTRVTTPTNANYRKAYINVVPVTTNGTTIYKITVRIQSGTGVVTAINSYTVTNPPPTLRIGFSASTGGNNAIHEIRGLAIVQAPIAVDDNVATPYNKPITFYPLNNDINGGGANINPATIDLNPSTIATDNTYSVAQGTFSVDNTGAVTFTPNGSFSGTFSIPYTVQNLNQNLSNLGNINVIVTGADVETVVSGPTSVNPGTKTSYSVTTTNNGKETATNVIPTLTLPTGYALNGALPAGATSSVSGGVTTISFAQTTLTAGQSTTTSVNVQAPSTPGSAGLTSSYTYPTNAVVPDAVSGNNSSTLNVTVTGSTNIAGVCSVPGKDGPVTLAAGATPDTYYAGTTANAGSNTLTVNTTATPTGATAIAAGDLLLIMQMQGATMNTTATSTNYGTVSAATAGTYEYAVAASTVSTTGSLTLARPLTNTYTTNTTGSTFQVIRIPQYSSLTVTGAITGPAWNGSIGGVLALEVAGTTTFSGGGLNMNGKGFRGGAGSTNTSNGSSARYAIATTDVTNNAASYASKGEGIAGTPFQVYTGGATATTGGTNTYDNYASGSLSLGQPATGGGGAMSTTQKTNISFGGGGGGANGGTGGTGQTDSNGNGANAANAPGGNGGAAVPAPSATQFYLGGGGGAGATSSATAFLTASGGTGGGIIILRTGTVSGTTTISANGNSATNVTATGIGGGGGGAGGTVVLLTGGGQNNLTVTATGGAGGTSTNNGDGGGGSGGVLISNVTGFASSSVAAGATNNATAPRTGATIAATSVGGNCAPSLIAALSTTTPNVARANNMQTTYVYTVSNTGGGITGLTASPSLAAVNGAAGLFTYASMTSAVVQYTDGTSQTLASGTDYTVTNSGTSTPTFTLSPNFIVPSGASVVFTFVANIASTAVVGTAYGSNAATSYFNPQRTTATGTATAPAYASSNGTSADVVTIVVPLPVKLTKFTVVAAGADAILNWETAQEVNNHYFEVERSLDGQTFESAGTVAGNGTTMLTSTYRYTDAGASTRTANVLYYRLRQVDFDGQSSFSPVRAVQFSHSGASIALYPNPTTSSATLDLSQLPAGDYAVQVFETTGRLVQSGTYQPGKQTLSLESLPTGTYFVKVQGASLTKVLSLIKQ